MPIIREQLILADKAILEDLSFVKKVERTMMDYEELKNYAITQLPVAAVVGKLPKTEQFKSSDRIVYNVDQVHDDLVVDVYFYFQRTQRETMDEQVSTYANDLYAALFADPGRGGLCNHTFVEFSPDYMYWDPFVAFRMMVTHKYIHTTGGI